MLSAFAALASGLWLLAILGGSRRSIPHLPPRNDAPSPAPRALTVLVASRDEGEAPRRLGADLRAQRGPLTIRWVLVDDRSRAPIAAEALPEPSGGLSVLRLDAAPEGWLGKVHALHRGLELVDDELVLLTDADVRFEPDALATAVGYFEAAELDYLCLLPRYDDRSWLLEPTLVAAERLLLAGRRAHAVGRPGSRAYVGLGAFALVRRSALSASGGFTPLRLAVLDDVALARQLRDHGARLGVLRSGGHVHLEQYGHLGRFVRGQEKTMLAAGGYRPLRTALVGVALLALALAPLGALCFSSTRVWGLACLATGTLAVYREGRLAGRRSGWGAWVALGHFVMGLTAIRAAVLGALRGGLAWRDATYSLEMLRVHWTGRRCAPQPGRDATKNRGKIRDVTPREE